MPMTVLVERLCRYHHYDLEVSRLRGTAGYPCRHHHHYDLESPNVKFQSLKSVLLEWFNNIFGPPACQQLSVLDTLSNFKSHFWNRFPKLEVEVRTSLLPRYSQKWPASFELRSLSVFERAFENVNSIGIGCRSTCSSHILLGKSQLNKYTVTTDLGLSTYTLVSEQHPAKLALAFI